MALSPTLKKRLPLMVGAVVAVAVLVGGIAWWQGKQRWESTDNAFVAADTTEVSPQIDGYVVEVLVADNQRVAPGQILIRLDDANARAALAQAEANLASVIAAVGNVDARAAQEQALIASRAAGVAQAQAQADLARQQVDRYGKLAEQGWVSQQRIQTEQAGARTAQATVAEAQAALVAEQRTAGVLGSTRSQSVAAVEVARAQVEQARIALDRTVIRAPVAGVIGARGVRVGQYVRPGGQILSIVPLGDAYVVANFKETQVDRLRLGQTVEISADAYPGQALTGHIDSFSPATGSEFALIPIENATGNFTKITQRVPVRIRVDRASGAALRPGLSVEVKVDLKSRGGLSFAQAATGTIATAAADTGVAVQ
ncbi:MULTISPECIES: HlyD family secretion protein [unclassified Brevundimonas]|uniref:HlyD family secretion protein n=1 Tax=unclassified Brevundimonas TaxID=2622653 RepID=UPI0006FAED86|nr:MULTISPECIES: HlyD family secretion protein [unclassified Brevundimonas]KQY62357.1 hemolysin secretion protein D [Brevundimonas sp. Root1423]KRA21759.1 hemolysin secretion protein D [Brevundimonas sp. Root608]